MEKDRRARQLHIRPRNARRTYDPDGKGVVLENKSVTFYADYNNAMLAILKNSAKHTPIQAMAGIIWHRIRQLNITPRFGRVPSERNIADLPTRRVKIQYKSLKRGKFRMAIDLHKQIDIAIDRISKGLPTEPTSTRNREIRP